MERGRKLTRFEKECCQAQGVNPKEYLFSHKINDSYFAVINREKGTLKILDIYRRTKSKWGDNYEN